MAREAAPAKPSGRKAAAAPKVKYPLEVKSLNTVPTYVYGPVTLVDEGYRIEVKRPRSPKTDVYIVPDSDVILALVSPTGYVLTASSQFPETSPVNVTLIDPEIKGDIISGLDANGAEVYINKANHPVTTRYASYAE